MTSTIKSFAFPAFIAASLLLAAASCSTQKHAGRIPMSTSRTLLATADKGWLKFKIYQLPTDSSLAGNKRSGQPLVISIMIVNMQDGASPLRRICANLEQYNVTYEYLLNQVKNDLALVSGTNVLYPSYCSFENNYNAFPFETLNVGFSAEALSRSKFQRSLPVRLLYMDKVFAHDTVTCEIVKAI